ncbi:MAG: hypothetical protein MRJ92_08965 [Nitrospira sp.]|nr:hypothetical protein [Nitrospira sp.]
MGACAQAYFVSWAVPPRHVDVGLLLFRHDGLFRDQQRTFLLTVREEDLGEHAGTETLLRIGDAGTHLHGSGGHLDLGVIRDGAAKIAG